jgi:hypothetical protein
MKHRIAAIVFVMICASYTAFPQSKQLVPRGSGGRQVALVIGNSSYSEGRLENAANDAADMRKALRDKGFTVSQCCDNVGIQELTTAIDDWTMSLQRDDRAIFYFSGHGIRVNSTDYLVPIGYPSNSTQADVRFRAYAVDQLQEKMQERGTKVNLIILDACRDNPYVLGKGLEKGMAGSTAGFGTYIIYAASPGHVASVNAAGKNSLFTLALLEELEMPSISLRTLGADVRDRVYEMSDGTQIPYISENVVFDVVLGAASGAVTVPARDASTPNTNRTHAGAAVSTPPTTPGTVNVSPKDVLPSFSPAPAEEFKPLFNLHVKVVYGSGFRALNSLTDRIKEAGAFVESEQRLDDQLPSVTQISFRDGLSRQAQFLQQLISPQAANAQLWPHDLPGEFQLRLVLGKDVSGKQQ